MHTLVSGLQRREGLFLSETSELPQRGVHIETSNAHVHVHSSSPHRAPSGHLPRIICLIPVPVPIPSTLAVRGSHFTAAVYVHPRACSYPCSELAVLPFFNHLPHVPPQPVPCPALLHFSTSSLSAAVPALFHFLSHSTIYVCLGFSRVHSRALNPPSNIHGTPSTKSSPWHLLFFFPSGHLASTTFKFAVIAATHVKEAHGFRGLRQSGFRSVFSP